MWKALGTSLLLVASPVLGETQDRAVPWGYAEVARAQGVPAELLFATALAESGALLANGCLRPWPWTLTVQGRTERFNNRQEAHRALLQHLEHGRTAIRVGLMQIEWQRYNDRLGSPADALEPYHNLREGSKLLLEAYQKDHTWRGAVRGYHARTMRRVLRLVAQLTRAASLSCGFEAPAAGVSPQRERIAAWVQHIASGYAIDPALVMAVIEVESGFDTLARSNKRAQGLMQLIPATASRFGVSDPWDPVQNIRGGTAYLHWLLRHFNGDVPLSVAAYNAGEKAVEQHRGIPPYTETRNYVQKILSVYQKTQHPIPPALVAGPHG